MMFPKDHGGMAMSNLVQMDKVYLMKLGWALRSYKYGLWGEVLLGKYNRGAEGNSGQILTLAANSHIWKAIANLWPIIVENEICIIGDGGNINVWQEKWINGSIKLIDVIPHIPSNFLNLRVKDLTDLNGEWDITLLNSLYGYCSVYHCYVTSPRPSW